MSPFQRHVMQAGVCMGRLGMSVGWGQVSGNSLGRKVPGWGQECAVGGTWGFNLGLEPRNKTNCSVCSY